MSQSPVPSFEPINMLASVITEAMSRFQSAKTPEEQLAVATEMGPELIAAYTSLKKGNEKRQRACYVADLASRFCQTTVETTEDQESLRDAARRSVLLADFLLQESEKLNGVK